MFPRSPRKTTIATANTISGGIATYSVHGESGEALIAAADAALYDAKRSGRNRVLLAAGRSQIAEKPMAIDTAAT